MNNNNNKIIMEEKKNGYKGWLNSKNFLKRALAIFLYNMLGNIIFSTITIIVLITLFGTLAGIFGKLNISFNKDEITSSQKIENKIENKREIVPILHPSWDLDHDGKNDCVKEGTCDHTIDYALHKNVDILNAPYSFKINDKEMEIIQFIDGKALFSDNRKETYTILKDTIVQNKDENKTVAILKHETGGTGVFYYVVAFLNWKASNALYIGDRIKINKLSFKDNIVIEYMDRKKTDSMADAPTVKKVKAVFYVDATLTGMEDINE